MVNTNPPLRLRPTHGRVALLCAIAVLVLGAPPRADELGPPVRQGTVDLSFLLVPDCASLERVELDALGATDGPMLTLLYLAPDQCADQVAGEYARRIIGQGLDARLFQTPVPAHDSHWILSIVHPTEHGLSDAYLAFADSNMTRVAFPFPLPVLGTGAAVQLAWFVSGVPVEPTPNDHGGLPAVATAEELRELLWTPAGARLRSASIWGPSVDGPTAWVRLRYTVGRPPDEVLAAVAEHLRHSRLCVLPRVGGEGGMGRQARLLVRARRSGDCPSDGDWPRVARFDVTPAVEPGGTVIEVTFAVAPE